MRKLCRIWIFCLIMACALTACQAKKQESAELTVGPTETPTSIVVPTEPPTPTVTPTESPTPTVVPSELPTPTEPPQTEMETIPELSISERLQSGDFSCLVESDVVENERVIERYQRFYNMIPDRTRRCISYDLNGDGIEDLIWQEEFTDGYKGAIMAIFACTEDSARCVFWDEADYTYRFFFSSTEKLILCSWNNDFYACTYYGYYEYDVNWNRELVYGLKGYHITDFSEWSSEEWFQEHPEMGEVGSYFFRVTETGGTKKEELLEQDEFLRLYEELTGFSFDDWVLE